MRLKIDEGKKEVTLYGDWTFSDIESIPEKLIHLNLDVRDWKVIVEESKDIDFGWPED